MFCVISFLNSEFLVSNSAYNYILNGANSRTSAKMEMKREMKDEGVFKHFNGFVTMLVFYI